MGTDPIKQARQIIKAHAEDRWGLSRDECREAGFSEEQCNVLVPVIYFQGVGFTESQKKKLEEAGFSKTFIDELTGPDGKRPLNARIRWFADRITPKNFLGICWKNCDIEARIENIITLSEISPKDAMIAMPDLMNALPHKNRHIRFRATMALATLDPSNTTGVPLLIEELHNEKNYACEGAAVTLGKIGPAATAAVPDLTEILKSGWSPNSCFNSAVWALGQIGPPAAVPTVPVLVEELKFDGGVNAYVLDALVKMGVHAVPNLIEALEKDNLREGAMMALEKIGPAALPKFVEILQNKNAPNRFYIAKILDRIGPDAKEAVPALIQALADPDDIFRSAAAETLGEIGPSAFWAIPELEKMAVNDPDPLCRRAAKEALDRLKGQIR